MTVPGASVLQQAIQYLREGRPHQAEAVLRELLRFDAANAHALHLLGVIALQAGKHAPAVDLLRAAIASSPGVAVYHGNLGVALKALGRSDEAIAEHERAIALDPANAEFHSNLGTALRDAGAAESAIACFERAIALRPARFEAHYNLGNALRDQGRLEQAVACYDRALALRPEHADAHVNRGMTQLLRGDFAAGWDGYEHRNDRSGSASTDGGQPPQWRAEPLAGKTILLRAEQGFGDTLQFVRYAPMVAAGGASVVLEVQPELFSLLQGMAGADRVMARGMPRPEVDLQCPLPSLPRAFGTTLDSVPSTVPYVAPSGEMIERWRIRIASGDGARIGLAWAGSPTHVNDRNRSLPFAALRALAGVPGVRLFSLQKGPAAGEAHGAPDLVLLGDELRDFADTAAVIAHLDLVISVDTSVAHLAGAMGKPVWVLLPFVPDWRWLWQRSDSPWYPTARLFRQPQAGDWGSVTTRVLEELARLPAGAGD